MQSFSPYWFYPWLVEGPATYGRFRFFTVRDKTPLKPPFLLGRKNQIYLGMLGNYFHQTKPELIFSPLRLAFLSALPLHKLNFHLLCFYSRTNQIILWKSRDYCRTNSMLQTAQFLLLTHVVLICMLFRVFLHVLLTGTEVWTTSCFHAIVQNSQLHAQNMDIMAVM